MRQHSCLLQIAVSIAVFCSITVGQGTASPFAAPFSPSIAPPFFRCDVDLDQDGYCDRISYGSMGLFANFGVPGCTPQPPQILIPSPDPLLNYRLLLVHDFNHDGLPDMLVVEWRLGAIFANLHIYLAVGYRRFGPPIPLLLDPSMLGGAANAPIRFGAIDPPGQSHSVILSARWDGNASFTFAAHVFDPIDGAWNPEPIGSVGPSPTGTIPAPFENPLVPWITANDFNGDGIEDLYLGTSFVWFTSLSGQLAILQGIGVSPWLDLNNVTWIDVPPPVSPGFAGEQRGPLLAIDDVNGDGIADLVGAIAAFPGSGATLRGGFARHELFVLFGGPQGLAGGRLVTTVLPTNSVIYPERAIYDYDLDGVLDIVLLTGLQALPAELHFYRGQRDGTFSPPMIVATLPTYQFLQSPNDPDCDGDLDVVATHDNPRGPFGQDSSFRNDSLMGLGTPAISGVTPRLLRGTASLGNQGFAIGVDRAPANAACALAVSLAPAAGPGDIGVDLNQLLWPLGAIGPTTTDFRGVAFQSLPLPNLPVLAGATLYFQWGVATQNSLGFCLTPTAKVVLWP